MSSFGSGLGYKGKANGKAKQVPSKWSKDEDERLIHAVVDMKMKKWPEIAAFVGTKSTNACYQHWRRVLDPAICKEKFSDEEKVILAWAIKLHGTHSWKRVADAFSSRTDAQCRARWMDIRKRNTEFHDFLMNCIEHKSYEDAYSSLVHALSRSSPLARMASLAPFLSGRRGSGTGGVSPSPLQPPHAIPSTVGMSEHIRHTPETTPALMHDAFLSDTVTRTTPNLPTLASPFLLKLDVESVREEFESDDIVDS